MPEEPKRKFEVSFTIEDLDPIGDVRDIQAITENIIRAFGPTYKLQPVVVTEIIKKTAKDYLQESLNQSPLHGDPYY